MDGWRKGRLWPKLIKNIWAFDSDTMLESVGPCCASRQVRGRADIDPVSSRAQAKKKPRPKARQFIREETPRKGRGVSDASQSLIYGAPHNRSSEKCPYPAENGMQWPFVWDIQGIDPKALPLRSMLHRSSRAFWNSRYVL